MTLVSGDGRFKRIPHDPIRLWPTDSLTWHAELTINNVGRAA